MTREADAALGRWLRRTRAEAGLTQQDLADRSGLSVRTISNMERGQSRKPYPSSVRLVATALGLSEQAAEELIAWYRGGGGPAPEPRPHAPPGEAAPQTAGRPADAVRVVPLAVPRQLPAGVRHFTGRAEELGQLSALLSEIEAGAVIATIAGTAGVGKSALAVHWAHQTASRFPDGQIYVNLRGFDQSRKPVPPGEAIRGFLDALEVPAGRIPATVEAQAGLYRSLASGRRMLVILDNARDSGQVRPLLPGSPGCMVLVTSRNRLTGLVAAEDAHPVSLDVLSPPEAGELLEGRLGAGQVAAEPAVISELAGLCARLPLALSIVAARATAHRDEPLGVLAAGLRDAHSRLDTLDTADTATTARSVFSWSCQQLSEPTARMFRLLGLHPGPDISLPAAASLAGLPADQARLAVDELAGAHLVSEHRPGRFTFHDLLRAYAAEQCQIRDAETERHAAIGRVLGHYFYTEYAAAVLYRSSVTHALPPPAGPPGAGVVPEELDDRNQAQAWFRAEHKVLMAAAVQAGGEFDWHAIRISLLLSSFLNRSGYRQDGLATGLTALAAARRLGDTEGEACAHWHLGAVSIHTGAFEEADAHLRNALTLYQQIGDSRGLGDVHNLLQGLSGRQHRHADALHHAEQALRHFRIAGHQQGEGGALNNVAWSHIMLGNIEQALPFLRQARDVHRSADDITGLAATWDSLGYAYFLLGRLRQAITCYRRAGLLVRELADRPNQALVLTHLGDAYQAVGQPRAARQAWQQALDIRTDLNHPDAEQLRAKLASLPADVGGFPLAGGRAYDASDRAKGSGHDARARRPSAGQPG